MKHAKVVDRQHLDCTDVSSINVRHTPAGGVAFTFICRDTTTRNPQEVTIRLNLAMLKELHAKMAEARGLVVAELDAMREAAGL